MSDRAANPELAKAWRILTKPWAIVVAILAAFVLGWMSRCTSGAEIGSKAELDDRGVAQEMHANEAAATWTCAMHPQIHQPHPGKCPICGMDLIPVPSGGDGFDVVANRVVLSERAKALARLRTTTVTRREDAAVELRLLGRVEPDETTQRTITAWISGRIDRLHVRATGTRVRQGQVIATLYSPEVYAAHQDLLVAERQRDRLRAASPTAAKAAEAAFAAARQRLGLLGIPEGELARMIDADGPRQQIEIRSPFAGTVIERLASEGAYVATGAPLYRTADLSRVWVQLDAYARDLGQLQLGQAVRLEVEAYPGQTFAGTIAFVDPTIDPQRRTARVRVVVDNREGRLLPGMFASARVDSTPRRIAEASQAQLQERAPLVVPDTAPLMTGRRAIVYVEVAGTEKPTYEARVVRLGPRTRTGDGGVYPVVSGLSEGERVVTRGAFVLDADLQIRGGASMMDLEDEGKATEQALQLGAAQRDVLAPVLDAYLGIQEALAEDDLGRARTFAGDLVEAVERVRFGESVEAAEAWSRVRGVLRRSVDALGHADGLESARAQFETTSEAMADILRVFGNPLARPLRLAFCPMAKGSAGAAWIQHGDQVANAYFGAAMRRCGEFRETIPPGSHLSANGDGGGG